MFTRVLSVNIVSGELEQYSCSLIAVCKNQSGQKQLLHKPIWGNQHENLKKVRFLDERGKFFLRMNTAKPQPSCLVGTSPILSLEPGVETEV